MDNASKALIMAGAILIAVALVGVGVYLYSSAAGMMNSGVDELASADMITKNSKLEIYEGNISGTELKQLKRAVTAYNKNEIFPESIDISDIPDTIRNSQTYAISFHYDDNGWIDAVYVDGAPTPEAD